MDNYYLEGRVPSEDGMENIQNEGNEVEVVDAVLETLINCRSRGRSLPSIGGFVESILNGNGVRNKSGRSEFIRSLRRGYISAYRRCQKGKR